jgi:hypothetical protein
MQEAPPEEGAPRLPAAVRLLQWLVIGLTASLIVGLITVVTVVVIRFPRPPQAPLPETVTLPAGTVARAVTTGGDWFAVVTEADEILVFDRRSGRLRQRIAILPAD